MILTGANLTPSTRLALPFKATQKPLPDAKPNLALVRLHLTVDAGVAPGVYPIRAVNDEGQSALAFFRVDTLPGTAEVEDNNTFEKAQKVAWPVRAEVLGSRLDGVLKVSDAAGRLLAQVDDVDLAGQPGVRTLDPSLEMVVPAGVKALVAELSDRHGRGGVGFAYRFTVRAVTPDFDVLLPGGGLNLPKDGTALLPVQIVRRGHAGMVRLVVPNPPAGVTVQGGTIPAGTTSGFIVLRAGPDVPAALALEGWAVVGGKELRRLARRRVLLSREAGAAGVWDLAGVSLARSAALPFGISAPGGLVLVKGYPTEVAVKLTRAPGQDKLAISVTGAMPGALPGQPGVPGGFAFKPAAPTLAGEARFTITPGTNAPDGEIDLAAVATAQVGPALLTAVSAATLTVRRPVEVRWEVDKLELKPGATVAAKVKVTRQPVCKEPIRLMLTGLPLGVSAAPLAPVPATASEAVVTLKIDPKAASGMGKLALAAAATIGGQNHAQPAVMLAVEVR
jgi:hypothetical protein